MTEHQNNGLGHRVVRASAGAGKTYQLTTRYLDLISRGEDARQILATTFTRKAAGEVLGRVLGRVSQACVDPSQRDFLSDALGRSLSESDCVQILRGLTDHLGRLSVGTIDGFFNRAARAMSLELGLPPDPRLIDEGMPLAKQMRTDAIQAVLGEQAAGESGMTTLLELLRRLHHDTAQRSVAEAIDSIVNELYEVYRSHPDRALWDTLPETGLLSAELLTAALHELEQRQDALPRTKAGAPNKTYAKAYNAILEDAYAHRWDSLIANGLIARIVDEDAKNVFGKTEIPEPLLVALRPLIVHAKAVRLKALSEQTLATYTLLQHFDQHYTAIRNSRRVLLFSDLTHLLAEGLPGLGSAGVDELCYRLDARVTHLLLDEFQDTSLRQWEVLRPFAEQITDNFEDSRSLYCVGDTKQAIYSWRGGCAELFDEIDALPGVEQTTLTKSWRSSQVVLDAVNQVFSGLASNPALDKARPAAVRWSEGFEHHEAVQSDLPGYVVLRTTSLADDDADASIDEDSDDDAGDTPPDAHAAAVAMHIRDIVQQMPGRSIGVLVRSRKTARTLIHALRNARVDAAEEGGNPIVDTPAVSAVLSAIQLADHPGDGIARFHVLNSPVGQVIGLDPQAGDPAVESIARDIRRDLIDRGYAAVIADWVRALAPSCDEKSLRRLEQLVAIAEGFDEHDAGLRPGFFVEAAKAQKVEDASPAPVRVMTIHASKGLEFDVVVLPDLEKNLSQSDSKALVLLDRDSPIAPVRAVYRRPSKSDASLMPDFKRAIEQYAFEQRTEDLCLLYVAMTRARQALHLMVRPLSQNKNGNTSSVGLSNLSYAAILRQALTNPDDEGFAGGEVIYEAGDPAWHLQATHADNAEPVEKPFEHFGLPIQLVRPAAGSRRSWAPTSPSALALGATVAADDLLGLTDPGGRRYGTMMHALFEQVGFIDEGPPDDQSLRHAAQATGASDAEINQAIEKFNQAIQCPAIAELLSRANTAKLWRERPFVARLDDKLVRGIFDRVHLFEDAGQTTAAHLIDFKTDRVDDSSIDQKVADYRDQLGTYRDALASLLGLPVEKITASLCFVSDGRVVEVT